MSLQLFFAGPTVLTLDSDQPGVLERVQFQFAGFTERGFGGPPPRLLSLTHTAAAAPGVPPGARVVWKRPHYVAQNHEGIRWVTYHGGRATLCWDREKRTGTLYCSEADLAVEMMFMTILAVVGAEQDDAGFHRLHAGGLAVGGRSVLLSMDSTGGKTTMLVGALQNPSFELLSDDSPLITRGGTVHPFPLKIGLRSPPEGIPDSEVQHAHLVDGTEKWFVAVRHFAETLPAPARPGLLLVGKRTGRPDTVVAPTSKLRAALTLGRTLILGRGLRQGPEVVLAFDGWDFFRLFRVFGSRALATLMLIARSETIRFEIGTDVEHAVACFAELADNLNASAAQRADELRSD